MQLLAFALSLMLTPVLVYSDSGVTGFAKAKIKSSQALQSKTLYLALSQRCTRYFNWLDGNSLANLKDCETETRAFLTSLDIAVVRLEDKNTQQTGFTTVVFKSELLHIMQSPATYLWLQEIESELQLANFKEFDLFANSKKIFRTETEVIRMIAVLMQDTSLGSAHIAYLASLIEKKTAGTEKPIFQENFKKLLVVQKLFSQLQGNRDFNQVNYQLYPLTVSLLPRPLSATQYHFYVVAYNTLKLIARPSRRDVVKSFFVNSVFNYLYEVMGTIQLNNLLHDQTPAPSAAKADIMLGHFGGIYALGLHPQSLNFSISVDQSPQDFFRAAIKQLREHFPLKR